MGNTEPCVRSRKEARVAGVRRIRKVEWNVGERWAGAKSRRTLWRLLVSEEQQSQI